MRPLLPVLLPPVLEEIPLELSGPKFASRLGCLPDQPGSPAEAFATVLHRTQVGPHAPPDDPAPAHPPRRKAPLDDDPLDAASRHAAQLAPPLAAVPAVQAPPAAVETQLRTSLEDLLPALVRRVAWSGDGKRGTVRLELGSGALAGATLLIHADEGRVRVQLSGPPGVDLGGWRERIAGRLAARGLPVDDVETG